MSLVCVRETGCDMNHGAGFFSGKRNLSGVVSGFSASASDMGMWIILMLPGSIYAFGAHKVWIAIGILLGTAFNWWVIAERLRAYSAHLDATATIPDFFEARFHDQRHIIKLLLGIVMFAGTLLVSGAFLAEGAKMLQVFFEMDYLDAIIFLMIAVVAYVCIGGFFAVCRMDVLFAFFMLISVVAVSVIAVIDMGPRSIVPNLIASFKTAGMDVSAKNFLYILIEDGTTISVKSLISEVAVGLCYCGMPHVLMRFIATRDEKEIVRARKLALVWQLFFFAVICVLGVIGRAYLYPLILENNNMEYRFVYSQMLKQLAENGAINSVVCGCLVCFLFTTFFSGFASKLLLAGATMLYDIPCDAFKKRQDDKMKRIALRVAVLLFAIFACIIASKLQNGIVIIEFVWQVFGAIFGPVLFFTLFWKRTTLTGIVSGMLLGAASVVVWKYFAVVYDVTLDCNVTFEQMTGYDGVLVGIFITSLVIMICAAFRKRINPEILKEFEDVQNGVI